jgi:hypothetical protein
MSCDSVTAVAIPQAVVVPFRSFAPLANYAGEVGKISTHFYLRDRLAPTLSNVTSIAS